MNYDLVIVGGGPAGLAAGLYAGRSRLSVLIIEKGQDCGQIAITDEIENYPGQIVEGESGPSLIARMTEQAAKFGAERVSDTIKEVELNGDKDEIGGGGVELFPRRAVDQHPVFHAGLHGPPRWREASSTHVRAATS